MATYPAPGTHLWRQQIEAAMAAEETAMENAKADRIKHQKIELEALRTECENWERCAESLERQRDELRAERDRLRKLWSYHEVRTDSANEDETAKAEQGGQDAELIRQRDQLHEGVVHLGQKVGEVSYERNEAVRRAESAEAQRDELQQKLHATCDMTEQQEPEHDGNAVGTARQADSAEGKRDRLRSVEERDSKQAALDRSEADAWKQWDRANVLQDRIDRVLAIDDATLPASVVAGILAPQTVDNSD